MPKYPFLSADWIEAARSVHAEVGDGESGPKLRMNLVIEEVPFGSSVVEAHLDTMGTEVELDLGHLDAADLKVSTDYATAKAVLVDSDSSVALQAFMAGKIRVEGDMAKLLELQASPPSGAALVAAERIRDLTE